MDWVLRLAEVLESEPDIHIIFDRWDVRPGTDIPHFMEKLKAADRVVVICTPDYVEKVNARKRGSGYEGTIISNELVADQTVEKFVPVLREGAERPTCLQSKAYADFRHDADFAVRLLELLAAIRGQSHVPRPPKRSATLAIADAEDDAGLLLPKRPALLDYYAEFAQSQGSRDRFSWNKSVELSVATGEEWPDRIFDVKNRSPRSIFGTHIEFELNGYNVQSHPLPEIGPGRYRTIRGRDLAFSHTATWGRFQSFAHFVEKNIQGAPARVTLRFSTARPSEDAPFYHSAHFLLSFHRARRTFEVSPAT